MMELLNDSGTSERTEQRPLPSATLERAPEEDSSSMLKEEGREEAKEEAKGTKEEGKEAAAPSRPQDSIKPEAQQQEHDSTDSLLNQFPAGTHTGVCCEEVVPAENTCSR